MTARRGDLRRVSGLGGLERLLQFDDPLFGGLHPLFVVALLRLGRGERGAQLLLDRRQGLPRLIEFSAQFRLTLFVFLLHRRE